MTLVKTGLCEVDVKPFGPVHLYDAPLDADKLSVPPTQVGVVAVADGTDATLIVKVNSFDTTRQLEEPILEDSPVATRYRYVPATAGLKFTV